MISQTAEYALRAVVCLAEERNRSLTIQQVAILTQAPAGYLAKVMKDLAQDGVLISQRGLRGGFILAKPPSDLTIYEVLQAVDPVQRIHKCPLGKPEHASQLCALHKRLDEAAEQIEGIFRSTSVAELTARPVFGIGTPTEEKNNETPSEPSSTLA